jgi:hypothetical protein
MSPAFADRGNRKGHSNKQHKSGHRANKPHFKQGGHKGHRGNKSFRVNKQRPGAPVQKQYYVGKKHRSDFRSNKRHGVQRQRGNLRDHDTRVADRRHSHSRYNKSHRSHKPRFDRRFYKPRFGYSYRPYPRVYYPHYHPYGHRLSILPHGFISLTISGLIYYYASGNYYKSDGGYYVVVQPPIGALIPVPPPGYKIIYIDSHPYYLSGGVYYIWDNVQRGYRVVQPPEVVYETKAELPETLESSLNIFVYPREGQTKNEQANDRYECHLWAVGETDFDPTREQSSSEIERDDYRRAITACLEARDYTVK